MLLCFFADNVVLLASSDCDLEHALRCLAVECEAISLCQKMVDFSIQVGSELLHQMKEFKYLETLLTSEGKIERETDRRKLY